MPRPTSWTITEAHTQNLGVSGFIVFASFRADPSRIARARDGGTRLRPADETVVSGPRWRLVPTVHLGGRARGLHGKKFVDDPVAVPGPPRDHPGIALTERDELPFALELGRAVDDVADRLVVADGLLGGLTGTLLPEPHRHRLAGGEVDLTHVAMGGMPGFDFGDAGVTHSMPPSRPRAELGSSAGRWSRRIEGPRAPRALLICRPERPRDPRAVRSPHGIARGRRSPSWPWRPWRLDGGRPCLATRPPRRSTLCPHTPFP